MIDKDKNILLLLFPPKLNQCGSKLTFLILILCLEFQCVMLPHVEFVSKVEYLQIILNCKKKDDDDISGQLRSTYGILPICCVENLASAPIP